MLKQLAVVFTIAAAAVSLSFAQPGPGPGPGAGSGGGSGARGMRQEMKAKLNLTEQQETQMQTLRFDLEKKQTTLQSKIKLLRIDMKELLAGENPEKNAITKKMKEVSDLELQEKVNVLDHMFAVKAILTPEQQKIWKQQMRQMGPEMKQRMMGRMMERRIEREIDRD
jgi:Spy/CpxP family protein refolding chaperone